MRKHTSRKKIIYAGVLVSWTIFCFTVIPHCQEQNRKAFAEQMHAFDEEHEANYVHIVDSNNIVHCIPAEDYYAEKARWEDETLSYEIPSTESSVESTEQTVVRYQKFSRDYTTEDVELMAHLIESEAGIESYECKQGVASMVLNRCASQDFPGGLEEVIYQRVNGVAQFSVTIEIDGVAAIDACVPSEESYQAALDVMDNGCILPQDVLFFYSDHCNNAWLLSREVYTQVDHTIFTY